MKKGIILFAGLVFLVNLSGCATANRQRQDLDIQGLRNQISVLETQLKSKDEEVANLKDALDKSAEVQMRVTEKPIAKKTGLAETKSHPKVKEVQLALKNAGYNPGSIDGKMGKQTREALREFQRANKLTANGKANKKTWALLKEYLTQKIK